MSLESRLRNLDLPIQEIGGPNKYLSKTIAGQPIWTEEQIKSLTLADVFGEEGFKMAEKEGHMKVLLEGLDLIKDGVLGKGGFKILKQLPINGNKGEETENPFFDFVILRYFFGVRSFIMTGSMNAEFPTVLDSPMGRFFASQSDASLHIFARSAGLAQDETIAEAFASLPSSQLNQAVTISFSDSRFGDMNVEREIVRLRGNLGYMILEGTGDDIRFEAKPGCSFRTGSLMFYKADDKVVQNMKEQADLIWNSFHPAATSSSLA